MGSKTRYYGLGLGFTVSLERTPEPENLNPKTLDLLQSARCMPRDDPEYCVRP